MFSPTMRTAVFQALVIHACSLVFNYHIRGHTFDKMMENEGFGAMWNATERAADKVSTNQPIKTTRGRQTLDAGPIANITTSLNQTTASSGIYGAILPAEPFYTHILPKELVVHLVIFALQYWWHIGLERILPGRPRSKEVPPQKENKVEMSEDREEEVVQKWIAQGKVQRASLSWCNTFLKWVLVMTVGELAIHIVGHVVRQAMKFSSPKSILAGLKSHLIFNFIAAYFSTTPLAVLMSFVLVPAHKRIVFVTGAELVWELFYGILVRAFAVRVIKTDFAQRYMRNVTEFAQNIEAGKEHMPETGNFLKYDEL